MLTFGGGRNIYPAWSPDARFIVFSSTGGMSWIRADGVGKPQMLTQSSNAQWPWSFTPDGKYLAFQERSIPTGWDLWTIPVENDGVGLHAGKPEKFLVTQSNEKQPSFSPDGRWLAYSSDDTGTNQVYVRSFPDNGGRWQVLEGGGQQPAWSHTGYDLFFRNEDNQIMSAAYVATGESFVRQTPKLWSESRLEAEDRNGIYDLARDGKRIVALMPAEEHQTRTHFVFVENFFDDLRRRVPLE
jgi:eukaryotic-like serine/threonine-protein kinase